MLVKSGLSSVLVLFLICLAIISINIYLAKRGRKIMLRRIAALDAVKEGVGRAVELRKPVAVDCGLTALTTVDGIVSLTYLDYAAKLTAELGAQLIVGVGAPEVTPVAEDIVRTAYTVAGKEELYNPVSMVRYISSHQWGYTAGWIGLVAREKPAMVFISGTWVLRSCS